MEPLKQYTRNYFKTYFWKLIGYVASFASLIVVTPHLSTSPAIFGIFTFCISLNIFFQYADLGFLNAAQKYASEYYGRGDLEGEIKVTGFCCLILLIIFVPICLGTLWLSQHPGTVIKGISSSAGEMAIASRLLFLLFVFSPVMIFQRIIQMIFTVRVEGYQTQRINIIVAILRVASIFYFFTGGRYEIVAYFLFFNCLGLVSLAVTMEIAWRRFHYNFWKLLKHARFSRGAYQATSRLAYNSLFLATVGLLFYELDLVFIGYFVDNMAVAYYALGFTLLTFFRDGYNTFFTPFMVRMNHLLGQGNEKGVMNLYDTLFRLGIPVVLIPVISIFFLVRPLILSWVGPMYEPSILVAHILMVSLIFEFVTYPTRTLMLVKEKLMPLYLTGAWLVVVFITGVLLTQHVWGMKSYAIFKVVALIGSAAIFYWITLRTLQLSIIKFVRAYFVPVIVPVLAVVLLGFVAAGWLQPSKGAFYLVAVGASWGGIVLVGFGLCYLLIPDFRSIFKTTLAGLIGK